MIKLDKRINTLLFSHEYEPWYKNCMFGRENILNCLAECKKMLDFEAQKRKALLDSDVNNLTAVLQAQQATMMKLENIEKKRIAAQEKAGFGEMKADEIIEKDEEVDIYNLFDIKDIIDDEEDNENNFKRYIEPYIKGE